MSEHMGDDAKPLWFRQSADYQEGYRAGERRQPRPDFLGNSEWLRGFDDAAGTTAKTSAAQESIWELEETVSALQAERQAANKVIRCARAALDLLKKDTEQGADDTQRQELCAGLVKALNELDIERSEAYEDEKGADPREPCPPFRLGAGKARPSDG